MPAISDRAAPHHAVVVPPLSFAIADRPASGRGCGGGDWYDVVPVTATTTALVVGNVVGRGPHAASRVARVRGVLNALLDLDPGSLFHRAHALLGDRPDPFIGTAAVFLLDVETRTLTAVRAGHPPALLHAADGALTVLTGGLGPALGLAADAVVPACAPFDEGSTLIAYTDGLLEPRGQSLDDGIAALVGECRELLCDPGLSPMDLIGQLIATTSVDAWRTDDITVVATRHTPHPTALSPAAAGVRGDHGPARGLG